MKNKNIIKLSLVTILSLQIGVFAQSIENTNSLGVVDVISSEESAYGETKGYVVTKSSTGSKMDVDIREIPQSVSVVTRDMMSTRNVDTIEAVTSYTSALTQQYGEGDTRANYGRIRGLGYSYESTFLDGLKLLEMGHLAPNINTYGLERVEVLKGPSSVLYGASGPGGLINMQSKKANGTDSGEIGISAESFNTKSVFADINRKINDKVSIRLVGKYKKGDAQLKDSPRLSYFFNPSLVYKIDDSSSLDLYTSITKDKIEGLGISYGGAKATYNMHNSIALNSTGIKNYITSLNPLFAGVPTALWKQAIQTSANKVNALNLPTDLLIGAKDKEISEKKNKAITAVYNKSFNESLSLKSSFRATKMDGIMNYSSPDQRGIITALGAFTPDLTKIQFDLEKLDSSVKTLASDTNVQYKWNTQNIENTSLLGLDFQYTKFKDKGEKADKYTYDLKTRTVSSYVTNAGTIKDETTTVKQLGVYVQNAAKINEKYVLSTSLRYDKLKEKENERIGNTSYDKEHSNISGRAGLVYLLNDEFSPYITYSTSFLGNDGADKDGKEFKPSIGKQYEIGLKYKPQDINAFITLAAYHLENTDVVTADTNPLERVQEQDMEVKGLEFDITANPTENMNLVFSFTKMKGKSKNTVDPRFEGANLTDIPKFSTSLWSDYTFKKTIIGDLKLGAGVKYTGESDYVNPDNLDLPSMKQKVYKNESYTVVDMVIATQYDNWNIALNVNNVLDETVVIANGSISGSETQGRTYGLTASYKF